MLCYVIGTASIKHPVPQVYSRFPDGYFPVFPGNVFPGKKPSGKVTIRETTIYRATPG